MKWTTPSGIVGIVGMTLNTIMVRGANHMQPKAAGYIRVSSKEQLDGESLSTRRRIRLVCLPVIKTLLSVRLELAEENKPS